MIYDHDEVRRAYCFITDMVTGMIKCVIYGTYDVFPIACDKNEATMDEPAKIYKKSETIG